MKNFFATIAILIILPSLFWGQKVFAEIVFSEIAWMGSVNSSTDEWIELYNNGSENVTLDGYIIESESKKVLIRLSGSISANAYYLIERTDDNSVQNVVADLVTTFGTGLNNSGDNLYLKNPDGNNLDSLIFGSGWPAGDNSTKQTMQYVNSNWVTADATPKKAPLNTTQNSNQNTDNSGQNNQTENQNINQAGNTSGSGGGSSVPLKNQSRFIVTVLSDQLAGLLTEFEIDHRDEFGNKNNYGVYRINFGDGNEKVFKPDEKITHTYEYPGYYRLTVKHLDSNWSLMARKQTFLNVEINEPLIYIDTTRAPILIIKNKSSKDIDLNNFVFTQGSKNFNPPAGSILFAGKDLWLSPGVTGFTATDFNDLGLLSKLGQSIAYDSNTKGKQVLTAVKNVKSQIVNNSKSESFQNSQIKNDQFNIGGEVFLNENVASVGANEFSKKQKNKNLIIWFLFGGLVLAGSFIFIKLRNVEIRESEDFTLLEE